MIPVKLVVCRNPGEMEHTYILHTSLPYQVGKLVFFYSPEAFRDWAATYTGIAFSPVPGYTIAVVYEGTLSGRNVPADSGAIREAQALVEEMAHMYHESIIRPKHGHYVKFKMQ